ncbi:hypothetical protein HF324_16905 [Chitinophaga oryzae]|uniref:DUF6734 domain-containing protein n=1 Tax=Chitinophaga oryzae TaxID=2725414 RepID=A0ABX6LH51_9BACT|nr:DUF6734 family protein [Chitinophaga oryzae]QJB39446.1 hypothetical protein HF324_16905 [Chitinophaga oryzae]
MLTSPAVIQTLCLRNNGNDPLSNSLGFPSPEFNWMSWALSAAQLHKLYGEVHLYTNDAGKEVLIDRLQLPYTHVHTVFSDEDVPAALWAVPKVRTYSLQKAPFVHFDGDTFLWERIDKEIMNAELITQNQEHTPAFYRPILQDLLKQGAWLPDYLAEAVGAGAPIVSYNAGVMGGKNIDFFQRYTNEAFRMIQKNRDKAAVLAHPEFNMIYEQVIFGALAARENIPVKCYFPEPVTDMVYRGITNFNEVPSRKRFIHMLGSFKSHLETCLMLAKRLRKDFPEYYYRIISECKKSNITMQLRCYQEEETARRGSKQDWHAVYEHERMQFEKFDLTFGDEERLSRARFQTNKLLRRKMHKSGGEEKLLCRIPSGYVKMFRRVACDEMDTLLLSHLGRPRRLDAIMDYLRQFFDEAEIEKSPASYRELVLLHLKRGCGNQLFSIS